MKMFKRPQLILGRDLDEQLARTLEMCGSGSLLDFVQKERIPVHPKIHLLLSEGAQSGFEWESLRNANNAATFDSEGLDLMKKMLESNPEKRISVAEALEHSFLKH